MFGALGLIPSTRPTTEDVFISIELNYKAVLNAVGSWCSSCCCDDRPAGATDPVCGMTVTRDRDVDSGARREDHLLLLGGLPHAY